VSMALQAIGLADIACHVMGCHLNREKRFETCVSAVDDVARNCRALPGGTAHVLHAWGGAEGTTAVAARREMDDLLEEFVSSRDAREARGSFSTSTQLDFVF